MTVETNSIVVSNPHTQGSGNLNIAVILTVSGKKIREEDYRVRLNSRPVEVRGLAGPTYPFRFVRVARTIPLTASFFLK